MQHDKSLAVADDAFDVEVIYRRHLSRYVIVFEMFGHFRKFAPLAKTEYRHTSVDVDDTLMAHAERKAAVLVHQSTASERHSGKSGLICTDTEHVDISNDIKAKHIAARKGRISITLDVNKAFHQRQTLTKSTL